MKFSQATTIFCFFFVLLLGAEAAKKPDVQLPPKISPYANLYLSLDIYGGVDFYFDIYAIGKTQPEQFNALKEAVGVFLATTKFEEWEFSSIEQDMGEYHYLYLNRPKVFSSKSWKVEGKLRLNSLLEACQTFQVNEFSVHLELPPSAKGNFPKIFHQAEGNYSYKIATHQRIPHLAFSFLYQRETIQRLFFYLLSPLIILLFFLLWTLIVVRKSFLYAPSSEAKGFACCVLRYLSTTCSIGLWLWWLFGNIVLNISLLIAHEPLPHQVLLPGHLLSALFLLGLPLLTQLVCTFLSQSVWRKLVPGVRSGVILKTLCFFSFVGTVFVFLATHLAYKQQAENWQEFLGISLVTLFVTVALWIRYLSASVVGKGEVHEKIFALGKELLNREFLQISMLPTARAPQPIIITRFIFQFSEYIVESLSKAEFDAFVTYRLLYFKKSLRLRACILFGVFAGIFLFAFAIVTLSIFLIPAEGQTIAARMNLSLSSVKMIFVGTFLLSLFATILCYYIYQSQHRKIYQETMEISGNPEAFITAQAKIHRFYFSTPKHWKKGWSEILYQHRKILKIARHLARDQKIEENQLLEILGKADDDTSRYSIPEKADPKKEKQERAENETPGKLFSSANKQSYLKKQGKIQMFLMLFPPVVLALWVEYSAWEGILKWIIYGVGVFLIPALSYFTVLRLNLRFNEKIKNQFWKRFQEKNTDLISEQVFFTGIVPDSELKTYEGFTAWDMGIFLLRQDSLVFRGEETHFVLKKNQIRDCKIESGYPSLTKNERIYIHWRDEESQEEGKFSFSSPFPIEKEYSLRQKKEKKGQEVFRRWQEDSSSFPCLESSFQEYSFPKWEPVSGQSMFVVGNVSLIIINMIVWGVVGLMFCFLLDLKFDLKEGDTGWFLLISYWFTSNMHFLPFLFTKKKVEKKIEKIEG